MSLQNGRDYLYLLWKDIKTRRRFIVGVLSKNGNFQFQYGAEVDEAIKAGFNLLIAFPDKDKIYEHNELFPTFSSRLPDKKRKGIETILAKYDLKEYDSYEYLKKSGAKLPIDSLEFVDPILNYDDTRRQIYLAGTRHYLPCKGESAECSKQKDVVEKGESLVLECEPDNIYDENAVKVTKQNHVMLGYLPRYLAKDVSLLLQNNKNYECLVVETNYDSDCTQCIKVEIAITN